MTLNELSEHFALPGVLHFEQHGELTRARVTLPTCEAVIYLQGAQLTHWQPTGQQPVLFLSEHSTVAPGKAIRGGIPICFPWFGNRSDGAPGPAHGFARIEPWELAFAAIVPNSKEGDRLQLTFVLDVSGTDQSYGFDGIRVAFELLLGRELSLRLTVVNFSGGPLRFEEALHTYFRVGNIHETTLSGLESAAYLDKRDGNLRKTALDEPLVLTSWTDRVFAGNTTAVTLRDAAYYMRRIHIKKQNSATTVVWNPWAEGAATLPDLGPEEWTEFIAVETANTGVDAITLAPGQTHTMSAVITVEPGA